MNYLKTKFRNAPKNKYFIRCIVYILLLIFIFRILNYDFSKQINFITFSKYIFALSIFIFVGFFLNFYLIDKILVAVILPGKLIVVPSVDRIRIEFYFLNTSSFLKPNFTFDDFVSDLNLSKKNVSNIINHEMNISFYNLLAEKRIDVAQYLLVENRGKLKISALANQCGFVSKSSFILHFRKRIGMTPSEFQNTRAKLNFNTMDR